MTNSLRLAPKLSENHLTKLKFGRKMKVKLASHVLSNTVSSAIDCCVAKGALPADAAATSTYLKKMNDIFDCLNSSFTGDKVKLRKPLQLNGSSLKFLEESKIWLQQLSAANPKRRVKFIDGFIQSFNVVINLLRDISSEYEVQFICTRQLCQDPLELFFGKIRQICCSPDARAFCQAYGKIAAGSLIKEPVTGNCEASREQLSETIQLMTSVSTV